MRFFVNHDKYVHNVQVQLSLPHSATNETAFRRVICLSIQKANKVVSWDEMCVLLYTHKLPEKSICNRN